MDQTFRIEFDHHRCHVCGRHWYSEALTNSVCPNCNYKSTSDQYDNLYETIDELKKERSALRGQVTRLKRKQQ